MSRRIVLVLGGARSGKSAWAERRVAARSTPVTYVAAGALPVPPPTGSDPVAAMPAGTTPRGGEPAGGDPAGGDPVGVGLPGAEAVVAEASWAERVAAHRARRPATWVTVEVTAGGDLAGAVASVPGDVLVDALGAWLAGCAGFAFDGPALVEALEAGSGEAVVVSEEVGLGVHPYAPVGQAFRDALGLLNGVVSAAAAEAVLVVTGRALSLPAPDAGAPSGGATP